MNGGLERLATLWWEWAAPMAVQVAILALAVGLIERLAGRWMWPQQRMLLWWLVFLKLGLPPSLTSPISLRRFLPEAWAAGDLPPEASAPAGQGSLAMTLFSAWIAGAALLALWGGIRYARIRLRISAGCSASVPVSLGEAARCAARRLGLRRLPPIWISTGVVSPAVVGLLRPRVVLPERIPGAGAAGRLEHVLLHELAHIRRRDPVASALTLALQIVFWFHPLVWIAAARIAALREQACDRVVAGALEDARWDYRATLIAFAGRMLEAPAGGGLTFVRPRAGVLERIRLLDQFTRAGAVWRRGATALLAGALAICCIPLGAAAAPLVTGAGFAHLAPRGCIVQRLEVMRLMSRQAAGDAAQVPATQSIEATEDP